MRKQINSWVKRETSGLVADLIPKGSLFNNRDNSGKFVFTNVLYFKGSWDELSPLPLLHGNVNQNCVMVPFLAKRKEFGPLVDGSGMLNHPFRKQSEDQRAFNMLFFYPAKHDSSGTIDFGSETLMDVSGIMTPKFTISSELEASEVLRRLGVERPFSGLGLTKIISSYFYGLDLYVSKIFQKTFLETNEQGIEAATSTAAIFMSGHDDYDILDMPEKVENGIGYMAKAKLVVQAVSPITGM